MNRPNRRARLNDIADIATSLRDAPIQAPDFTSSILDRVDVERPFLAPSVRRRLPWIRIGLGACVALGTLAVALTHRWAPEAVQLADQPAPISEVVESCVACQKLVALRPAMLTVSEKDASKFFAAVVTAARVSEGEGRGPTLPADEPVTVASILPLSQAVALDTPAAPTGSAIVHGTRSFAALRPALSAPQSVLPEAGPGMAMSSDLAKPRIFPSPLDLDSDMFGLAR